jgi:hypothetical protein
MGERGDGKKSPIIPAPFCPSSAIEAAQTNYPAQFRGFNVVSSTAATFRRPANKTLRGSAFPRAIHLQPKQSTTTPGGALTEPIRVLPSREKQHVAPTLAPPQIVLQNTDRALDG